MKIPIQNCGLLILFILSGVVFSGCSGDSTGDTSRRKKPPIVEPLCHWETDYDVALKKAKEEDKLVFALFTGKEWCKPCFYLNMQLLGKKAFADWANENVILLELDYPKSRPAPTRNLEVQKMYRINGYPTMLILLPDGSPIMEPQYRKLSPQLWTNALDMNLKSLLEEMEKEDKPQSNDEKKAESDDVKETKSKGEKEPKETKAKAPVETKDKAKNDSKATETEKAEDKKTSPENKESAKAKDGEKDNKEKESKVEKKTESKGKEDADSK